MLWQLVEAHFYAVSVAFLTLLGAVILMQERRSPQSTLAWILAMLAVPWLAVPLFLMLGTRKIGRRMKRPAPIRKDFASSRSATFEALGAFPAREGNRVALIDRPDAAMAELLDLVRSAQKSIDAQYYIVGDDAEGRAFVNALVAKARDGVRVRLMVDRIGTLHPPLLEIERLKIAGGQFHWQAPLINRWGRGGLNLRNHRKALIVDGKRLLTGGMNVAADYMRLAPARPDLPPAFDDLVLRVEGPAVADYAEVFRTDWRYSGGPASEAVPLPSPSHPGRERVQLVPAGPDRPLDGLHLGMVHAIHRANQRIWLATPYFLPTEALSSALATAARRGLDVRILLPKKSNHPMTDFARGAFLRELEAEGCRVLMLPHMLHAKAGIFDEMAWVGTANLDVRSLQINFETALMLYGQATVSQVEDWFESRFAQSSEGLEKAGTLRRLGEGLFRLSAPLL